MSGLDDVGDLAGQVLADPRQLRQILSGLQQTANRLGQPLDDARGATVGSDPKLVLAANLEKLGSLVEHRGDFRILHGHDWRPAKAGISENIAYFNRAELTQIRVSLSRCHQYSI